MDYICIFRTIKIVHSYLHLQKAINSLFFSVLCYHDFTINKNIWCIVENTFLSTKMLQVLSIFFSTGQPQNKAIFGGPLKQALLTVNHVIMRLTTTDI